MSKMSTWRAKLRAKEPETRAQTALSMARKLGGEAALELAPLLEDEKEAKVIRALCVALEITADERARSALYRYLEGCPKELVWEVCNALRATGHTSPLVPLGRDAELLRSAWLKASEVERTPLISGVRDHAAGFRFELDFGKGLFRFGYATPTKGTVRWGMSLFAHETKLYDIGSTCGTCESALALGGYPATQAATLGRELSDALARSLAASTDAIETLTPVISLLESGHYLMSELSFRIEKATRFRQTWDHLADDLGDDEWNDPLQDTDVSLHLGPAFRGPPPTFFTLGPSQEPALLSEERVAHYVRTIDAGERPSVLCLAWLDDRMIRAEFPERHLRFVILDGHHKAEAYARTGKPVNVLALFKLENCWGPRADPTPPIVEALQMLHDEEGVMPARWSERDWPT